MADYQDLLDRADDIRRSTLPESITAPEVGTLLQDIIQAFRQSSRGDTVGDVDLLKDSRGYFLRVYKNDSTHEDFTLPTRAEQITINHSGIHAENVESALVALLASDKSILDTVTLTLRGDVTEGGTPSYVLGSGKKILDINGIRGLKSYSVKDLSGSSHGIVISGEALEKRIDGLEGKLGAQGGTNLQYVTPEQYGAVGDGETDDTLAFNKAFNSSRIVVLKERAVYKVTGFCIEHDIVLYGNNATLKASGFRWEGDERGAFIFRTIDINLKVEIYSLNMIALNHMVGAIYVTDAHRVVVDNCRIEGNATLDFDVPAIESPGINQGITLYRCRNFNITNNYIEYTRTYAIAAEEDNENGLISYNNTNNTGRGAIYVRKNNTNVEVSHNDVKNAVRCFTVADGGIDLYGDNNEGINVCYNHIEGFGSEMRSGMGIRLKGSRQISCIGNEVITTEDTYGFAMLHIEDRYDTKPECYNIKDNYFNAKRGNCDYGLRIDQSAMEDAAIGTDINLCNNFFLSESFEGIGISIRRGVRNIRISNNKIAGFGTGIEFYNNSEFARENIFIENNFIHDRNGSKFVYINGLHINRNIIRSAEENIRISDCVDVLLHSNNFEVTDGTCITSSNNTDFHLFDDNVLVEKGKKLDINNYKFAKSYRGIDNAVTDAPVGSQLAIRVYGYTIMEDETQPSPDRFVEFRSVNDEHDLYVDINGFNVPDASAKKAVKVSSTDISNCEFGGELYLSDYRDWNEGVDVHMVEEHVFDGTETLQLYSSNSILVSWAGMKNAIGSDYRRDCRIVCNGLNNDYSSGRFISYANAQGSKIEIHGYNDYFPDLNSFSEWCKQKYEEGTPLRIIYALKEKYVTDIPSEEKRIYDMYSKSVGKDEINCQGLFYELVYTLDDEYYLSAKEIAKSQIEEAIRTKELKDYSVMEILETIQDRSIRTNGTISDARKGYNVCSFTVYELQNEILSITYAVSSDITNYPAFLFKDVNGKVIDVITCGTTETGKYTEEYRVPNNAYTLYVNTRQSQTEDIARLCNITHENKVLDSLSEFVYTKKQIDEIFGSTYSVLSELIG